MHFICLIHLFILFLDSFIYSFLNYICIHFSIDRMFISFLAVCLFVPAFLLKSIYWFYLCWTISVLYPVLFMHGIYLSIFTHFFT